MRKHAFVLSTLLVLALTACGGTSSSSTTPTSTAAPASSVAASSSVASSETPASSKEETTSQEQPSSQAESSNTPAESSEESSSQETEGYNVTFVCDENVSVYVYASQDYTQDPEQKDYTYAVDGDTGELLSDGNGQVNFKLVFTDGYELTNITIDGTYKSQKDHTKDEEIPEGCYRITKIQSDLTVTITSHVIPEEPYTVSFTHDANVSVYVYAMQDYTVDPTLTDTTYAVNSATGETTTDGTGQVNFKLVFADGYELDDINITGTYKNLKDSTTDEDIPENTYRVTKIETDLNITITTKATSGEDPTPTPDPDPEPDPEPEDEGYTVTFTHDDNVSVYVYATQDYTADPTLTDTTYAVDSTTGDKLTDGNGQVNFKLVFADGYELDDISIDGTYNSLKTNATDPTKLPEDTYRITKIGTDLTVTITSKATSGEDPNPSEETNPEDEAYKITFVHDDYVSVTVYETQTDTIGTVTDVAYSRDGDTGDYLKDGNGQVSFKITKNEDCAFSLAKSDITGTFKNLKDSTTDDTFEEGYYRITKIQSDLTVNITAYPAN